MKRILRGKGKGGTRKESSGGMKENGKQME